MCHPEIFIMTPPPYAIDAGKSFVTRAGLSASLEKIVEEEGGHFINIYADLLPVWKATTSGCNDLGLCGQAVANIVNDAIESK